MESIRRMSMDINEIIRELKAISFEMHKKEGLSATVALYRNVIFDLDRARNGLGRIVLDEENGS